MDSTSQKTNKQILHFLITAISKHKNASIIIGGDFNSSANNIENASAKRIEKSIVSNLLRYSYRFLHESQDA